MSKEGIAEFRKFHFEELETIDIIDIFGFGNAQKAVENFKSIVDNAKNDNPHYDEIFIYPDGIDVNEQAYVISRRGEVPATVLEGWNSSTCDKGVSKLVVYGAKKVEFEPNITEEEREMIRDRKLAQIAKFFEEDPDLVKEALKILAKKEEV